MNAKSNHASLPYFGDAPLADASGERKSIAFANDNVEILTLRQAAAKLGKSMPTLRRWIKSKTIHGEKILGRYHVLPAEIAAFKARHFGGDIDLAGGET